MFRVISRRFSTFNSALWSPSQSSVMVQFGASICELPLLFPKLSSIESIERLVLCNARLYAPLAKDISENEMGDEENELIGGFGRCHNIVDLVNLLQTVPTSEITAHVAAALIDRFVDLAGAKESRRFREQVHLTNNKRAVDVAQLSNNSTNNVQLARQSLVLSSILSSLVNIVCEQGVGRDVLSALSAIINSDSRNLIMHKPVLLNSLLRCLSERQLSLRESCEAVLLLSHSSDDSHIRDKLWMGIVNYNSKLTAFDVALVFSTLPYLKRSLRLVQRFAEDKSALIWHEFNIKHVLRILRAVDKIETSTPVLPIVCHWLSVNLHRVNENELLAMLYCLQRLNYVDKNVIRALERYTKIARIKDTDLMVTIADYLVKFGVSSKNVLSKIEEHLLCQMSNNNKFTLPQFHALAKSFGALNHVSSNNKLWRSIESHLERNVNKYPPKELTCLLHSFVQIGQTSIASRFVNAIRMSEDNMADIRKLKVALALEENDQDALKRLNNNNNEFKQFKENNKSLGIMEHKVLAKVASVFTRILGNNYSIEKNVLIMDCYEADLLIEPQRANFLSQALSSYSAKSSSLQGQVAVVLLNKSDLCHKSTTELGLCAMRMRHLRQLGLHVLPLRLHHVLEAQTDERRLEQVLRDKFVAAIRSDQ